MPIEVGTLLDGKVTKITAFGAFVALPEGKSGLVHISEISTDYVTDVHEHLSEGQEVKVRVVKIDENGRLSLSIRQANDPTEQRNFAKRDDRKAGRRAKDEFRGNRRKLEKSDRAYTNVQDFSTPPPTFDEKRETPASPDFEDMMSRFKARSDDKISDLNQSFAAKRGSPTKSRRRG